MIAGVSVNFFSFGLLQIGALLLYQNEEKIMADIRLESECLNADDIKFLTDNDELKSCGHSKIAQMVRMIVCHMSQGRFETTESIYNDKITVIVKPEHQKDYNEYLYNLSDDEIIEYMKGKQVEIKTSEGNFEGRDWLRNDWGRIFTNCRTRV